MIKNINDKEEQKNDLISKSIFKVIKDGDNIVDLGFGNLSMIKCVEQNKRCFYEAIDIDDETVKYARDYINSEGLVQWCEVHKGNIFEFDFKNKNVCICSRLFHHFDKNLAVKLIKKMLEIINFSGKIIIVDSIRDYTNRRDRYSYTPYYFVNEITNIINDRKFLFKYSKNTDIGVNQLWKLVVDINKSECIFELSKI